MFSPGMVKLVRPGPLIVGCNTDSQFRGSSRDNAAMGPAPTTVPYVLRAAYMLTKRPEWPLDAQPPQWVGGHSTSWSEGADASDVIASEPASNVVITFPVTSLQILQTPAYYFVMLGINDLVAGRTVAQVTADLINIIGQVKVKWPSCQAVICSGYSWQFSAGTDPPSAADYALLTADILAGAITNADAILDQTALPPTSVMGYNGVTWADGPFGYVDPHPAVYDNPTVASSWPPILDPQSMGVIWLACNLLQFLYPHLALPLRAGEVYP